MGRPRLRDARERADDVVVDEGRNVRFRDAGLDVWIEDFEEIAKALSLSLDSKILKLAQGLVFLVKVVGEGDGIESQIRANDLLAGLGIDAAVHDMVERRRAKRAGCLARILSAAHRPDVGRVIRPCRGRHRRILEELLLHRQNLDVRGGKQHDIDDSLSHNVANLCAKVFQRPPVALVVVCPWLRAADPAR